MLKAVKGEKQSQKPKKKKKNSAYKWLWPKVVVVGSALVEFKGGEMGIDMTSIFEYTVYWFFSYVLRILYIIP